MIDAVLLFGVINIVFEFVLLSMLGPRLRLRLLGSTSASNALHSTMLLANLAIHWGTLIGTMSAVLAFVASMVTVRIARIVYGHIASDIYTVGLVRYSHKEIT